MKEYLGIAKFSGFTILALLVAILGAPLVVTAVKSLPGACTFVAGASANCKIFPNDLSATEAAQLSSSIFSAFIGAASAFLASWLTGRQYERVENQRLDLRRVQVARAVSSEISIFVEQLRFISSRTRLGPNGDGKLVVQGLNMGSLIAVLPSQSTYEQLVFEAGSLAPNVSRSVTDFFTQIRRFKIECDAATGTVGLQPFSHLIRRSLIVLDDLDQTLIDIGDAGIAKQTIELMNELVAHVSGKDFQGREFSINNPYGPLSWNDRNRMLTLVRKWTELKNRPE